MINNDTAAALWDKTYKVMYPYFASRTVEDVIQNGTPHTGIKELDRDYLKHKVTGYLTIVADDSKNKDALSIVKLVIDRGIPVDFCNYEDVTTMYRDVRAHLTAWQAFSQTSYNNDPKVFEDLIKLDSLAAVLFNNFIKYHHDYEDIIGSEFARRLTTRNIFSGDVFANTEILAESEKITKSAEREYPSLANFFKAKLGLRMSALK